MKTVILCGGFGTRIRGVDDTIPKPMIPIGGLPIIWHIMGIYSRYGFNEFVLCLGYKGDIIRDFFLNYRLNTADCTVSLKSGNVDIHGLSVVPDWSVTLAETGLYAMTGARVKKIENYIEDETFMLTYGDGLGNVNLGELLKYHKSHGKIMTITGVRPPGRFGELEVEDGGKITGFNEKPQSTAGLISGGFFVSNKKIFDYLDNDEQLVLEKEPMKRLVTDGELMVYEHDGFWQPMDTYREYSLLNNLYNSGESPWND